MGQSQSQQKQVVSGRVDTWVFVDNNNPHIGATRNVKKLCGPSCYSGVYGPLYTYIDQVFTSYGWLNRGMAQREVLQPDGSMCWVMRSDEELREAREFAVA
jgi:hypothetical protein